MNDLPKDLFKPRQDHCRTVTEPSISDHSSDEEGGAILIWENTFIQLSVYMEIYIYIWNFPQYYTHAHFPLSISILES